MENELSESQKQAFKNLIIEGMNSPDAGYADNKYFDELREKAISRAQEKASAIKKI